MREGGGAGKLASFSPLCRLASNLYVPPHVASLLLPPVSDDAPPRPPPAAAEKGGEERLLCRSILYLLLSLFVQFQCYSVISFFLVRRL